MTTAFFSHPDCVMHDMGTGHPESPKRLLAIEQALQASSVAALLQRREAPAVDLQAVQRAHGHAHVAALAEVLQQAQSQGPIQLDADTAAGLGTWRAVQRAAGATVAATDAVIAGEVRNAFCAVRPPGHHATRERAMGFCFFNQVAIAALHALEVHGLKRVAVIDFDVHHGNGTEDILAGDERVLMAGLFQHPFYPFSGAPPLADNMLNLPLQAGADGLAVRQVVEQHWWPRLDAFAPQMIFISAGFDAHQDAPLGQLRLVESDYAWITREVVRLADKHAQGRIVSCLEGGYHLQALSRSVVAHLQALGDA